jgi:hypothetical protein
MQDGASVEMNNAIAANYIRVGFVRNARADLAWFVALPLFAVAVALGFHHWLPYIAQASIAVWITVPHHYATWVRTYGLESDWSRWKTRLIVGPLLLIPSVFLGTAFLPVSFALVFLLWDHQHSLMQQHGFARIYDFKAGSGAASTPRADFWLQVVLYGNLLVTAPLWSELWIAELYRWDLALRADAIARVHQISWTITGASVAAYAAHFLWNVAHGSSVNPMKYLFLTASYGLWYYVSWQDSFLVYTVAHRIMHGVQYILMVYWYVDKRAETGGETPRLLEQFTLGRFLLLGLVYALLFQFFSGADMSEFSFGLVAALQDDTYLQFGPEKATGFYAATAVSAAAAIHYYFDSFIWKVSDERTQAGL